MAAETETILDRVAIALDSQDSQADDAEIWNLEWFSLTWLLACKALTLCVSNTELVIQIILSHYLCSHGRSNDEALWHPAGHDGGHSGWLHLYSFGFLKSRRRPFERSQFLDRYLGCKKVFSIEKYECPSSRDTVEKTLHIHIYGFL